MNLAEPMRERWLTRRLRSQFLAFLMVGGTAAALNISVRFILNFWIPYQPSIIIAYLCGTVFAFTFMRLLVFEPADDEAKHRQFIRFALVNVVAIVQVWAVSVGLAEYVFPWLGFEWHSHDIAHIIGVATPIFSSYVGHKRYSFRK